MRVISGTLKGRVFDSPGTSKTHPMSERMRGALFNALGDIEHLTVLDAFGGSGALSLESISRGAALSTIIEIDKTAHKTINQNIRELGLEKLIKSVHANVSSWSDNNVDKEFDLVMCNPPFDKLHVSLIQKLVTHVKPGGLLVLSWPNQILPAELKDLELTAVREKGYGDAQLVFYRKPS